MFLGYAMQPQILRRNGVFLWFVGKRMGEFRSPSSSGIHPESGTPQGGVISPVLANVYLHYALDLWFEKCIWGQA